MIFNRRERSIVDILFLLALFAVFLISALFVILFGARIYKNTVTSMENNFNHRTSMSYITEKIRQFDYDGGIEIIDVDDTCAFKLNQSYNGSVFCTYLYARDGYLKELTVPGTNDFNWDSGQNIIAINSFNMDRITDSMYKCDIENVNGDQVTFYVTSYSNRDGGVANE